MADAKKKTARLGRGLGSLLGENTKSPVFKNNNDSSDLSNKKTETSSEKPNQQQVQKQALSAAKAQADAAKKADLVNKKPEEKKPEPAAKPAMDFEDEKRIWTVPIEKVQPNKNQPRKYFTPEALSELAASIKEKGILQPITVRRLEDKSLQIIAGERRWRAAQHAGLKEVPVIIRHTDEQDALELALIENIQRADLNPIEEAEAYHFLINKYQLTQSGLAEKIGKDRTTVTNTLRLLGLCAPVRTYVVENKISLGQAKALLSLDNEKAQKRLADQAIKDALSVRAIESQVRQIKAKAEKALAENEIEKVDVATRLVTAVQDELQKSLGTRVMIDYAHGKGKISIRFHSDDEFNHLVDRLRK